MLEAVATDGRTTQRRLAAQLGIALGLTNLYLKRLVRKGCIKCINIQPNRVRYLITPKGIAEKTRLTYEFMEYSLRIYREGRGHLRAILEPYAARSQARLAIFGTGEAAELAYLCLKEFGLEPVAVFAFDGGGRFFDVPVLPLSSHGSVRYDALIVASLQDPADTLATLERAGISRDRLLPLRRPADKRRATGYDI